MILAKGKFIYQGYTKNAVDYFGTQGFQCPTFANPADYLMELAHNDEDSAPRFDKLWNAYDKNINESIVREISNDLISFFQMLTFHYQQMLRPQTSSSFRRPTVGAMKLFSLLIELSKISEETLYFSEEELFKHVIEPLQAHIINAHLSCYCICRLLNLLQAD